MLARLAALLALMLLTAAGWWWWPVRPRVAWDVPGYVSRMHIAPNGQAVVLRHEMRLTYLDLISGARLPIAERWLGGDPATVMMADDGRTVVSSGDDITLWHPTRAAISLDAQPEQQPNELLREHRAGILCAVVGERVVTHLGIGDQLEVRVFDFQGRQLNAQHYTGVHLLQTLPPVDGRVLALLYFPERKELQVVDLLSGQTVLPSRPFVPALARDFDPKLAAVLSPDGRFLALLTAEGTTVHTVPTLARVCTLPTVAGEHFLPCEFNANGSVLVTYRWAGPGGLLTVRLWRIASPQAERLRDLGDKPTFSANGQFFSGRAGLSYLGPSVWVLGDISAPDNNIATDSLHTNDRCFAPDSRTLAGLDSIPASRLLRWLGHDHSRQGIRLLDLETRRMLPWFREGSEFAYFPDGRSLAILNGNRLEVWDVEPRRPWLIEWGMPLAFGGLVVSAGFVVRPRRWRRETA